ncbi:MAG: DUF3108 domain-containing protein [Rubrivivax sp.]
MPAVLVLHLWGLNSVALSSWGAGDRPPARLDVRFVQTLAPAAPPPPSPAAAATPTPARAGTAAPAAALAASAPEAAASAQAAASAAMPAPASPALAAASAPPAPAPAASAPLAVLVQAVQAVQAPAPAASAAAFEWPPSTRLKYHLTGQYRGPVEGQASVEWLRSGLRYQVRMVLDVGPSFAPLLSRLHASEGELTEQGLRPRRYDEQSKVVLRAPRTLTMWLDDAQVRLADGRALPRPQGVQDSASQFLQLLWLFTRDPGLLQAGQVIDMPLALPRHLDVWRYEVVGPERLATPVGEIDTVHVKPRRTPRPGVELTAEMWVAPSLQYLPVRLLIRQDAETFVDLLLTELPQQAAPGR